MKIFNCVIFLLCFRCMFNLKISPGNNLGKYSDRRGENLENLGVSSNIGKNNMNQANNRLLQVKDEEEIPQNKNAEKSQDIGNETNTGTVKTTNSSITLDLSTSASASSAQSSGSPSSSQVSAFASSPQSSGSDSAQTPQQKAQLENSPPPPSPTPSLQSSSGQSESESQNKTEKSQQERKNQQFQSFPWGICFGIVCPVGAIVGIIFFYYKYRNCDSCFVGALVGAIIGAILLFLCVIMLLSGDTPQIELKTKDKKEQESQN